MGHRSIASNLCLKGCHSYSYSLHQTERRLNVQIVDFRASFSEYDIILVLAFEGVSDYKVLNARLFGLTLEGKHIGLLFLAPFGLLIHTFFNFLAPIEITIALI